MVLQILIPPRGGLFQVASPRLATPRWQRVRRAHRRRAACTSAPNDRRLRALLVQHWSSVAVNTTPTPLPRPNPCERAKVSSRGLLKQCEGLLRVLCRHRRGALGLRQSDIADVARRFDVRRCAVCGDSAALAYVLALMHWRGYSMPCFLCRPPLHPPTGLVRWLSTFSVVDQVDDTRLLLEQLVREEARHFAHALAIVRKMQRMKRSHSHRPVVLLPELLTTERLKMPQGDRITTF